MKRAKFNRTILAAVMAMALGACGGGGSGSPEIAQAPAPSLTLAPTSQRLIAEIIASPAHIASSPLKVNAGYAGNLPASYAIQAAGQSPILDLLFVQGPDAREKLIAYAEANAALLKPGTRVLVADEVFWSSGDMGADTPAVLQPKLEKLMEAVALVRTYLPEVKVGITLTPYAAENRPNTLEYSKRAITLVDWVGTDPYWMGGDNQAWLNTWARDFPIVAKGYNNNVETWYIAQGFKMPEWDTATFNAIIKQQLVHAAAYDHVMVFGWQFVSEIDNRAAGMHFTSETRALYSDYLK